MKRILTIAFAALFAMSAGAFAASHMKGDKDKASADKKGGDMKSDAKKGKDAKK